MILLHGEIQEVEEFSRVSFGAPILWILGKRARAGEGGLRHVDKKRDGDGNPQWFKMNWRSKLQAYTRSIPWSNCATSSGTEWALSTTATSRITQ